MQIWTQVAHHRFKLCPIIKERRKLERSTEKERDSTRQREARKEVRERAPDGSARGFDFASGGCVLIQSMGVDVWGGNFVIIFF